MRLTVYVSTMGALHKWILMSMQDEEKVKLKGEVRYTTRLPRRLYPSERSALSR